jgi:hypothetical protein
MKAYYQELPAKFENVGNGSIRYRMNIQEDVSDEDVITYFCDEFIIWKNERAELVRVVIESLFGNGIEQKLLNDFNAAQAGILHQEAGQAYIDYLQVRKEIKEHIYADWSEYVIVN